MMEVQRNLHVCSYEPPTVEFEPKIRTQGFRVVLALECCYTIYCYQIYIVLMVLSAHVLRFSGPQYADLFHLKLTFLPKIYCLLPIFNRPGVTEAVLQSALLLINLVTKSAFSS